jgi:hypothetical protein
MYFVTVLAVANETIEFITFEEMKYSFIFVRSHLS